MDKKEDGFASVIDCDSWQASATALPRQITR